jgi:hypothetical protein
MTKRASWKDRDPTTVINIMRRALGGPEKYATEYAEEAWKGPWDIDNPESGPIEKFYLLKVHGPLLRKAGFRDDDLKRFSCEEIRKAVAEATGDKS